MPVQPAGLRIMNPSHTLLCLLLAAPLSGFSRESPPPTSAPSDTPDAVDASAQDEPPAPTRHQGPGARGRRSPEHASHDNPPVLPPPHGFRQQLLQRFDKDGDGQLNPAERKAALDACSKQVSPHGPKKSHRSGKPGPHHPSAKDRQESQKRFDQRKNLEKSRLLERFDTNGDGKLSETERQAIQAEMKKRWAERRRRFLNRFDTDGDGKLSPEEKAAARKMMDAERVRSQRRLHEWHTQFDANGDGKLDETEQKALRKALDKALIPPNPPRHPTPPRKEKTKRVSFNCR